ncbi:MAG: hypothetical protein K2Y15_13115, partial [Burkholderiaceae bacterium]|nr:hypothetical protein [Burkholderiaceae bacterium]
SAGRVPCETIPQPLLLIGSGIRGGFTPIVDINLTSLLDIAKKRDGIIEALSHLKKQKTQISTEKKS